MASLRQTPSVTSFNDAASVKTPVATPPPNRVSTSSSIRSKDLRSDSKPNPSRNPLLRPGFRPRKAASFENNPERPSSSWSRFRPSTAFAGSANKRFSTDSQSVRSLKPLGSVPSIVVDGTPIRPSSRRSERKWSPLRIKKVEIDEDENIPDVPPLPPVKPFQGISLDIPTSSLGEITTPPADKAGKDKNGTTAQRPLSGLSVPDADGGKAAPSTSSNSTTKHVNSSNSMRTGTSSGAIRAISMDEEILSRKVRLMYEKGDEAVNEAELNRLLAQGKQVLWEEGALSPGEDAARVSPQNGNQAGSPRNSSAATTGQYDSKRQSVIQRESNELAGGVEDWDSINNEDVDRYGFIVKRSDTEASMDNKPPPQLQRVSTSLLLATSAPRRKRTLRRAPSTAAGSIRSFSGRSPSRRSTDQSNRPISSQSSYQAGLSRSTSKLRYATNRLPHNRNRKLMDEAGDMLTLPTLVDRPEVPDDNSPYARAMKKKEWEREDKWRKMAKLTSKSKDGSGMTFDFDVKSSKLIERTWKGIPDRWRATAWYSFLSASALETKGSPTDAELLQNFKDLQDEASPDDVQIDIDVPRTISSHIMFRRRYRGGQRLLFRVLHAMSLYFPETGYVQGMAALAATFLAYYDEEHAFIMLVRIWQLRGLDRLYRSGFSGLMEALNNFENDWLDGGEVAEKLVCYLIWSPFHITKISLNAELTIS